MAEPIDVYWSFRSPYSYLVTPDLLRLREDYDVVVQMRVVYPIAVRDPDLLFQPGQQNKSRYIIRDSKRRADFSWSSIHQAPARSDRSGPSDHARGS